MILRSIICLAVLLSASCTEHRSARIKCERIAHCPANYVCAKSLGYCIAARSCTSRLDCCAGQKCANSLCVDNAECDTKNACVGKDFICADGICRRKTCATNSDCLFPNGCLAGFCVPDLPCSAKCTSDEVCLTPLDQCVTRDAYCQSSLTCAPGTLAVVENAYDQIGFQCQFKTSSCACSQSPALDPGKYGPYSRLGRVGDRLVVATYDTTYGDLVFLTLDDKRQPSAVDYIDGVPPNGRVIYDPKTIRNGVVDKGPDVGLFISMAVGENGYVAIAYYDRTNRNLKFAYREGGGNDWRVITVDTGVDVGRYTSIALANKKIHIAYLAETTAAGKIGLRYAISASLTPASSADFKRMAVHEIAKPQLSLPCNSSCITDEHCVEISGQQQCRKKDADTCSPICGPGSVCVAASCRIKLRPGPDIETFPAGIGLWTSLAVRNSTVYISYYSSIDGNLLLAVGNITSGFAHMVVDGESSTGVDTGDRGRFSSLAIAGATLGIAYQDADNGHLRYFSSSFPIKGRSEIVDDGSGNDVPSRVGADAKLLIESNGRARIVYQDSTFNDLRYAIRDNGRWGVQIIANTGALGFYADQVISQTQVFLSHLQIKLNDALEIVYQLRLSVLSTQ